LVGALSVPATSSPRRSKGADDMGVKPNGLNCWRHRATYA
jgi:hypothetical protein